MMEPSDAEELSLTGQPDEVGSRLVQRYKDFGVWLDNRFLASEERMMKRFDQSEDRLLKALAGYAEVNDRRFARNERAISDLLHRLPPQ